MDVKMAERRDDVRKSQRRRRLRRTILIGLVLVLALAAFVIERSSLVEVREVRVEGVQRLDPDDVRDAAGITLGTSTVRVRVGEVRERVEALPLVRRAEVRRIDALTVLIEVHERRPVAVVTRGHRSVLVDEVGSVLARGDDRALVKVQTRGDALPRPGEHLAAHPAAANALAAHVALPGPLRAEVRRYLAPTVDGLELVLASGLRVRFGRADRVDEKARAIGALVEHLGDEPVAAIDVRAPRNPVVIPSGAR